MEVLRKLTGTWSPSGNEEPAAKLIKEQIAGYVDEITTDALGNLIAHKKGVGKKIMLSAHMDEIGLIVVDIDDNGFLRFAAVGGVDVFPSLYQRVRFANGTAGVVAYEESLDEMKDLKFDKMYIDIGAVSKEEAMEKVSIGDIAVFEGGLERLGGAIMSKALDNRIGVYVLIDVIKQVTASPYDLYFVFSSQEEVGLRGAKAAAFAIEPDVGIAIDVTDTGDTPNCKKMAVKLGGGPAIKVKDSSVICHPKVRTALEAAAKADGVAYQHEIMTDGGTDAGAIHTSRGGVMTGAVSIPARYIHTPSELVRVDDVNGTIRLLAAFLKKDFLFDAK